MQPVFTQVPPNRCRSISATVMPAAVSRPASDGPAWPAPTMMASNRFTTRGRLWTRPLPRHRVQILIWRSRFAGPCPNATVLLLMGGTGATYDIDGGQQLV